MNWENVFKGLGLMGAGLTLIVYRKSVYGWTGDFDFFRKIFGVHGTLTFYVLLGAVLVLVGLLFVIGNPFTVENFLLTPDSPTI